MVHVSRALARVPAVENVNTLKGGGRLIEEERMRWMLLFTCLLGSLMSCASVDPPWPEDLASRPLRHQEHQAYLADHAVQSAAGLRLVGGQGGRRG